MPGIKKRILFWWNRRKGNDKQPSFCEKIVASSVLLVLFLLFFLPSASPSLRYSFRDVGYYYYPLFEQIQKCFEEGEWPWWNPYENLGQPLAGDPTASIFYPPKLIFFLSSFGILSFASCFKLYIWTHLALAFYALFYLAKTFKISTTGAIIGAISYAFSGHVLFQYTNVIYLVGAGWIPLHFAFIIKFFTEKERRSRIRSLFGLIVTLALSILGGEPQSVYLSLASSIILLLFLLPAPKILSLPDDSPQETPSNAIKPWQKIAKLGKVFGLIALAVLLLTSIQTLPSSEVVKVSTRNNGGSINSLWDLPKVCALAKHEESASQSQVTNIFYGLLCHDFSTGGKSASLYRFSVGPWRWLEFLYPNIGGKMFPESSRWFNRLPEEISVWTPTLYMGLVPILLASACFSLKPRKQSSQFIDFPGIAWNSWLIVISLLGALGGFGIVWFVRSFKSGLLGESIPLSFADGDPVGGLYWIFCLLLPYFNAFRYPAKLLLLSSVGISILAGFGWDRKVQNQKRLQKNTVFILTSSVLGLLLNYYWGVRFFSSLEIPSNPLYGPFQANLAHHEVNKSFIQTILASASFLLILRSSNQSPKLFANKSAAWQTLIKTLVVVLLSVDIYSANRWLIVTTQSKIFERPSTLLSSASSSNQSLFPTRIYRCPVWFPPIFYETSSERRNTERVIWDVETLFPKYSTSKGTAILDVRGSFVERNFAEYINNALNRTSLDEELSFLGVSYVLGPKQWTKRISPRPLESPKDAWDWSLDMRSIQGVPDRIRILRNDEIIPSSSQDNIQTISFSSNKIIFLVQTSQKSDLVISEQYWKGWKAQSIPIRSDEEYMAIKTFDKTTIDQFLKGRAPRNDSTQTLQVTPYHRMLRKVSVPDGKRLIVMYYSPDALYVGAIISGISWFALFGTYLWTQRRKRTRSIRCQTQR